MIETKTETVGSVKSRQVIWLQWMQEATAGLADDRKVITTTQVTPFGNYLIDIEQVIA